MNCLGTMGKGFRIRTLQGPCAATSLVECGGGETRGTLWLQRVGDGSRGNIALTYILATSNIFPGLPARILY